MTKEWIMDLCPEIAEWQAELIEDAMRNSVAIEREECARACDAEARMHEHLDRNGRSRHLDDAAVASTCAAAIRARK